MKKLGAWMLAALIVAAAAAEIALAQSGGNSGGSQSGASSGSATGQSGPTSGSGGDQSGDTRREGMPGSTSAAPGSESTSGPSGATMPGGSATTPTPTTAAPSTPGADVVAEDTETVRQAQIQLQSAGFSAGSANGIMDEQTRDAIRQFQQAKGLQVTGALDQDTQAALQSGAGAQNPANQVR